MSTNVLVHNVEHRIHETSTYESLKLRAPLAIDQLTFNLQQHDRMCGIILQPKRWIENGQFTVHGASRIVR